MRLLLDENLAPRLAEILAEHFSGITHLVNLGMLEAPDKAIWRRAESEPFAIVTKDRDFYERTLSAREDCKVIWIRPGNLTTGQAARLMRGQKAELMAFLQDTSERCFILKNVPSSL